MKPTTPNQQKKNIRHIAAGGIFFQGGQAAIDTNTIIPGLVFGLTGSNFAVGAAAAIAQYGWLFPQLFVAHRAERRTYRMGLYRLGAFGRVACLVVLSALLWFGTDLSKQMMIAGFFMIWTVYAFVGGIVAAPYNDIVARAVVSSKRSRLLAIRFFGGGLLALVVAMVVNRSLTTFSGGTLSGVSMTPGFAVVFLLAATLLAISAIAFSTAVEPPATISAKTLKFKDFVANGLIVLGQDQRFRQFLVAQWLGGVAAMAFPFYILQPGRIGNVQAVDIAVLLAMQTTGMLIANPLWGWWGDRLGKLSLLRLVAALKAGAPLLALVWLIVGMNDRTATLIWFGAVFFLLGAVGNGSIIAQLGYLMEISPDDRRPAYSGYFNMFAAPQALLPLLGAVLAASFSYTVLFAVAVIAAVLHYLAVRNLADHEMKDVPE